MEQHTYTGASLSYLSSKCVTSEQPGGQNTGLLDKKVEAQILVLTLTSCVAMVINSYKLQLKHWQIEEGC